MPMRAVNAAIGFGSAGVSFAAAVANEHALSLAASAVAVGSVIVPAILKWRRDSQEETLKEHQKALRVDVKMFSEQVTQRAELEVRCKALEAQVAELTSKVAQNTVRTEKTEKAVAAVEGREESRLPK